LYHRIKVKKMLKRNSHSINFIYRNPRSIILLLVILSVSVQDIDAQRKKSDTPPLKERLFYGTGIGGLQFGTITDIDISPVVGLWLLPRLNIAVGPKYEYYKYRSQVANFYGGRIYTEFVVLQDLDNLVPIGVHLGFFLHAEDEFFQLDNTEDRANWESDFINTPMLGFGISQPLGQKSSMNFSVLWPLKNYYNLYSEPEFRVSFTF